MNGMVIYVIDTETTGLDAVQNDVVEISMCRLMMTESGFSEEQKTWLLKAMNPQTISDEALAVNGHKREDILCISKFGKENYKDASSIISEIELWMMEDNASSLDRIFAGQNPFFDVNALQALWKKCGKTDAEFPFAVENNNRVIDTKMIVALFDLCTGRRRKYYNLSSLVKATGVKKGKAHQASEDVRMTKDLLLKLMSMIQPVVAEKFKDCYADDDEL